MLCCFVLDSAPDEAWTEDRADLPLYAGDIVQHEGDEYEITEGPTYVADWDAAAMRANFVVKPAPTSRT